MSMQLTPLAQASRVAADAGLATLVLKVNPLPEIPPEFVLQVRPGVTIDSLLPEALRGEQIVCRYAPADPLRMAGGAYLLRRDWQRLVQPGDHVEFICRAGGGDSDPLRLILQIAVLVIAQQFGPALGAALGLSGNFGAAVGTALITVGGTLAINALLPPQQLGIGSGQQASPAYNVALSGNTARLDAPIPVLYGYNPGYYPDFGAQPYVEYDNDTDDQYYHAYLVVGWGRFGSLRLEIDDTSITSFQDVEVAVLQPGEAPTLVNPNVVTAPEVSNQEIESGRYTAAIAACGPGRRVEQLGLDIVFNGLGAADNDGDFGNRTVQLRFDIQEIDDLGVPVGAWATLATENITAATPSPVRRSFTYTLASPIRCQVRAVRLDVKSESQRVLNTPFWNGLRAYLDSAEVGNLGTTRIEVRMRASEQLNGLSQRRISVTGTRMVRTWHPDTGWSAEPVVTRSPAWALADKWSNADYGDGLPDSRIDLQGLYELDQLCTERQDRCDAIFDTATDSDSADQLLATTMRAFVVRRNGVRTAVRDQAVELPAKAFTSRMMRPGTAAASYAVANSRTPNGVILEYFSNVTRDWEEIECPAPGYSVTDPEHPDYDAELPPMDRPIRQRLAFVRGATHARREGLFYAGKLKYRRKRVVFSTELQGSVVAYGKTVIVAPPLRSYGKAGDVVSWDAGSMVMVLSEPVAFEPGESHYLTLTDDRGNPTADIEVGPGPDPNSVVLAEAPGFTIVADQADRERPTFLFTRTSERRQLMRVVGIEPAGLDEQGAPIITIECESDDPRLHTLDAALLPGPGDDQDPIDEEPINDDDDGEVGPVIPEFQTSSAAVEIRPLAEIADFEAISGFRLRPNGRIQLLRGASWENVQTPQAAQDISPHSFGPNYWLRFGANEPSTGDAYECRVSSVISVGGQSFNAEVDGADIGTWVDLAADAEWTLTVTEADSTTVMAFAASPGGLVTANVQWFYVTVQVRDKDTQTVQATGQVYLAAGCRASETS